LDYVFHAAMLSVEPYTFSKHAVVRVLERTHLSLGQLLDRLNNNGIAWLPAKMPEGHRHALVYCASSGTFIVAILVEADRVVKTVVTLEQWENMYRKVANIWLTLAMHAAAQGLQVELTDTSAESLELNGAKPADALAQAMDVRLVAKFDGPKGPTYQDLFAQRESQWTALLGSTPAKRRYKKDEFLSNLAERLLNVSAFAELLRQRLIRHTELVMDANNLLLVFGPTSCPASLLPQVDVGRQLAEMVSHVEATIQKRQDEKARLAQRRHDAYLERQSPEHQERKKMVEKNELFALLTKPSPQEPPSP
jgi:hypothetical protein